MLSFDIKESKKSCIRAQTTRMERVQMSYDTEALVAKHYGGKATWHRASIDVVTPKHGIEVKAFHKNAIKKETRMTREQIRKKNAFCRRNKIRGKTVAAVVNDKIELYERAGFGNWDIKNMKKIGSFLR